MFLQIHIKQSGETLGPLVFKHGDIQAIARWGHGGTVGPSSGVGACLKLLSKRICDDPKIYNRYVGE